MIEEQPKLNLLFGRRCNNRCLFCLDRSGEPDALRGETAVSSLDEAVRVMRRDRARGGKTVAFGRLEPTLEGDFLALVAASVELGYEVRHLTSNGRILANRKKAEEIVRAGVNYFTLSVHAPRAAVHDELSGRKNAFAQTIRGVENLVALRRDAPLSMAFACTVTALNLPLLTEHYAFLQRFTPAYIGLNALLYSGRGLDHAERLSFPYAALEEELLRLVETHRGRLDTRVAVLGVPFCALRRVPPEIVGLRESFRMPSATESPPCDEDWVETGAAGDEGFSVRRIEPCERCAMRAECPGVSTGYLAHHGDADIRPLDAAYRERAFREKGLFSADPYRYPIPDPAALPPLVHRLARALAHVAGPEWELAGVSALAHENQAQHRLTARFSRTADGHRLAVEVEPADPAATYFDRTDRWGLTLGETGEEELGDAQAQARERMLKKILRVLDRI